MATLVNFPRPLQQVPTTTYRHAIQMKEDMDWGLLGYETGVSAFGLSHCTFFVVLCQK